MLCLESFHQAAHTKYAALILLAEACQMLLRDYARDEQQDRKEQEEQQKTASEAEASSLVHELAEYLRGLAASAYFNAATCMVQQRAAVPSALGHLYATRRGKDDMKQKENAKGKGNATSESTTAYSSSSSVLDLLSSSKGTAAATPLDWCNRGLALRDSPAGRYRKVFVLEKMQL